MEVASLEGMQQALDASALDKFFVDDLNDTIRPSSGRSLDVTTPNDDARDDLLLDAWVPVRTSKGIPATITRDELYLLLYVDGETSFEQISDETSPSLRDAVTVFLSLLEQGLVDVSWGGPAGSPS